MPTMISPGGIVIGKTAVALTVLELGAYQISPEAFSTVSVGLGAIVVGVAAIATVIMTNRNNRKNREQVASIAANTAEALRLQNIIVQQTQENASRLDGRLTELLESNSEISEAIGIKKGLQQAADAAVAKAIETADRDATIIERVADKVADKTVERIGDAADKAAQTIPTPKK